MERTHLSWTVFCQDYIYLQFKLDGAEEIAKLIYQIHSCFTEFKFVNRVAMTTKTNEAV